MKNRWIAITTLAFFIGSAAPVSGQSTGLDFLNVGPNTRSLSLAEAVTALPIGGSAIYTNPANLAFDTTSTLSADYSLWIADLFNSHIAVNLKRRENISLAFGLLNSSADNFEARSSPGSPDGTFSVNYLSIAAAYAQSVKNISFGFAGQFIQEEYLVNNAIGYSVNAGLSSHWMDGRLRAGASLLNMGEMNELRDVPTELPKNFRAGIVAEVVRIIPPKNENLPILVSLYGDYVKLLHEESDDNYVNLGTSFDVAGMVELRGGYKIGNIDRKMSFGVGIETEWLSFNYALTPFETGYGTAHSIGIEYYF